MKKYLPHFLFLAALTISFVVHYQNMFYYPYFESDEGTYISQAWALLARGEFAPYTYWYDHAPAGWMLIALWVKVTGGFFTFGTSVDSGRVFMLILHVLSSACVYFLTWRSTKKHLPAFFAVIFFSISPLAIYYQRRVLLDNIMVFYVLCSLSLLYIPKLRLSYIIASAVSFGIAILTKESAIFFFPAFIYVLSQNLHKKHFFLAIVKWIVIVGCVASLYILLALLKQEFFPSPDRVTLIGTLQQQLDRGSGLPFWNPHSDVRINYSVWLQKDRLFTQLGVLLLSLSTGVALIYKNIRSMFIFALFYVFFLIRGKLVLDFYIVPLFPFLGILFGIIVDSLVTLFVKYSRPLEYAVYIVVFMLLNIYVLNMQRDVFFRNETYSQRTALAWIKNNLHEDDKIIIDSAIFVDLHEPGYINSKTFPNADWSWKVEKDQEIFNKYENDWKNIDYIVVHHELFRQMREDSFGFIKKAYNNSDEIIQWDLNTTSYINKDTYESSNGDWMAVHKVKDMNKIIMDTSWEFYKENFIYSYGQVIDPSQNITTSEGQSYAMIRAVLQNDRDTFDGVWKWTKDKMQYRNEDKLLSWLISEENGEFVQKDAASASDADIDIAFALYLAHRKWDDAGYLNEAREIIRDTWRQNVHYINGLYVMTAGTSSKVSGGYLVNPSYISPAHYKIFAKIDYKNDWEKLYNDSYTLLERLVDRSPVALIPNWIVIDENTGQLSSANAHITVDADNYGFDAFRIYFRVALDYQMFDSEKAMEFLKTSSNFFESIYDQRTIPAIYTQDGTPIVEYESLSTLAGVYSIFSVIDPLKADYIYKEKYIREFNFESGYWKDKNNYYDQNWAWFVTALESNEFLNL